MVLIAIIAIVVSVISVTAVYYGLFENQVRNDLAVNARLLKDADLFEDLNTDLKELEILPEDLRVTWIKEDGEVLYDNTANAEDMDNHSERPEVIEAFNNGEGEAVRRSTTLNQNTFYYAILLDNGTVLRVSTDARNIWSIFFQAAPVILIVSLLIIIFSIVLSRMLTRDIVEPIEKMVENIDDTRIEPPYKELVPFTNKIRSQHTEILSAAKMRQDFTANVSHELKTPLTAITGYTELLESDMVDKEGRKHFYQEIKKNANRLLLLINDIIKLSELDHSNRDESFEKMNLYTTVSECLEELTVNAQNRNIELGFTGEDAYITGNRSLIVELVENLVQNAIRYNNEGGKVWVEVHEGDKPKLIVRDNGIGIPEADQKRVFERFYRVDKSRSRESGGTGLGLAIVKHIVEIHDGTIELKSELGKGTEITVTF